MEYGVTPSWYKSAPILCTAWPNAIIGSPGRESGFRHPNGGRGAMYIGVGTIVLILVIVLLIAFVF
jgi:hypothetical protein